MFFLTIAIFLIIKGKEVAVQDDADALQQACVDALPLEDVVHIGAVTVQLVGEPGGATLLTI